MVSIFPFKVCKGHERGKNVYDDWIKHIDSNEHQVTMIKMYMADGLKRRKVRVPLSLLHEPKRAYIGQSRGSTQHSRNVFGMTSSQSCDGYQLRVLKSSGTTVEKKNS